MEPFEDMLPEEQDKEQETFITRLRQAYSQKQIRSLEDQQEAIRRVEQRLTSMAESQMPPIEVTPQLLASSFLPPSPHKSMRVRPLVRAMSTLTAIIVVSILIGSATLLFTQHAHLSAGPVNTPVTVNIQWDGLEISMHVTSGPYFLGELLAVDLSLTNHTHPTLTLAGRGEFPPCDFFPLMPEQTGGTSPHYALYPEVVPLIYSCPHEGPSPNMNPTLASGQTFTSHSYVLLQSSGTITLTGAAFFYIAARGPQGTIGWQRSSGPLLGHLPTLHLRIVPQVPADRILTLQQENSAAVIHAPLGIHLLDQTYLICQDAASNPWAAGSGHTWEPLSTNVLHRPDCTGNGLTPAQWNYAIGAEGYEVAQGQQGQYTGLHFP